MNRWLSVIEPLGVYGAALFIVWGIRHGGAGADGQAWWLIPFIWMAAACFPALWLPADWLTREKLYGRPGPALWEVTRLGLIVFPAFGIAYLFYFNGESVPGNGILLPADGLGIVLYQFLYVGLPEELFFRGYLQQRLDERFGRPYRLFGAPCGWGLFGADLLFAIGHWVVSGRIANLDVFIPGLLFGWLKARTGAVLAPVLFHGLSNLVLFTLRGWTAG
jgi:membrane protease YdiL (CAAX protease family)